MVVVCLRTPVLAFFPLIEEAEIVGSAQCLPGEKHFSSPTSVVVAVSFGGY